MFILAGLAYSVAFYAAPLPSIPSAVDRPWRRCDFFRYLLVPEGIVESWLGDNGSFALADRLPIAALAGAILVAGWSAGALVLRPLNLSRWMTPLERFVLACAAGMNLVSLYTLAIGLAGGLRSRAWFVGPGMLLIGAAALLAGRDAMRGEGRQREQSSSSGFWKSPWFWLAIPFAILIVLGGMLPPIEFDVREYHLQAPKEFYLRGRVTFLPHNVYGNMALGSEMHSVLGMVLADDWWRGALVGKTVQALFAPLTALALMATGGRWFSASAGALAALVYLATPWIAQVSMNGLVEGAVAFYMLLAIHAALRWAEAQDDANGRCGWLAVSGFLAGSAVATKYPAALFVLAPILVWIAVVAWRPLRVDAGPRHAGWGRAAIACRAAAIFLATSLLACGPWFAKNWALTGNPTYPLLFEWFGGQARTEADNARWERAHRPANYDPRDLTKCIVRFGLSSEWLSPVAWPLAALAFVTRKRPIGPLLGYVAYLFLAWWLLTHRIDRFWTPVLGIVSCMAGASMIWASSRARTATLAIVVSVGLLYSGILVAGGVTGYNRFFAPLALLRVDPHRVSQTHLWLNAHVPRKETVLAVGDAQVFDLEMPVLYNTVFDESIFEKLVRGPDGRLLAPADLRRRLRGIGYLYVDWREIARYRSPGNYGFSDFVQPDVFRKLSAEGVLEPVKEFGDGAAQVFQVRGG